MKESKFADAQKAFMLKQGEQGTPVVEIYRKAGISQATYFNWKKNFGGLLPDEMRRLDVRNVVAKLVTVGPPVRHVVIIRHHRR